MQKFFGGKSEMREMNLVQIRDEDQAAADQQLTATGEQQATQSDAAAQ